MHRNHLLLVAATFLSGCALANSTRVDSAGVPVKSEDGFQSVDLALALNPTGMQSPNKAVTTCVNSNGKDCDGVGAFPKMGSLGVLKSNVSVRKDSEDLEEIVERLRLETAYYAFYRTEQQPGQRIEDRRYRVQQRLMGASDMNCGIFTQRIYGIQATGNFALGSIATGVGGAGAIVTQVNTARLLSGLSAITSGVRAELNEDFFRKQWIEALVKSIENERNRLRTDIEARSAKTISEYPVEAAVADAIRYNDACSLVSGLKEVNRAVAIADDPAGMRAFREAYERAGFDAKFSATVTSDGNKLSNRLRPRTSATASVGLSETSGDIAEAKAIAVETKARLDGFAPAPGDLVAAKAKIDALVLELYDTTASTYGIRLKPFADQLTKYRDDYATLQGSLAGASTPDAAERIKELMRANDAAAEIVRRAARDVVVTTTAEIRKEADLRAPAATTS